MFKSALKAVGIVLLVGVLLTILIVTCLSYVRQQGDVGGSHPIEIEVEKKVTQIVEVTCVVVVTATPDAAATQLADAYAKSTASVAQANAEATMVFVKSTQEAQLQRAAQTATSAAATRQVTPIRVTSKTASSTVTVSTVTPGPSPTPTQAVLRIAVVEDNSGGVDFRGEAVKALKKAFPEATVDAYKICGPRLATTQYDFIVMDYSIENSPDGATCARGVLVMYPSTYIVGWADAQREDAFKEAGTQAFVLKSTSNPNTDGLVSAVTEALGR